MISEMVLTDRERDQLTLCTELSKKIRCFFKGLTESNLRDT